MHGRTYEEIKKLKKVAHASIQWGIASGAIPETGECVRCGGTSYVVHHHPDYSKPLDTVFLCRSCHVKEHQTTSRIRLGTKRFDRVELLRKCREVISQI